MKKNIDDLALWGKIPCFSKPLPVGQMHVAEWGRVSDALSSILDRRYYTNHGPLGKELEAKLENKLSVCHAICMTNATLAISVAAVALELKGRVIVPTFTFPASAQALIMAGLDVLYCDVDVNGLMSAEHIEKLLKQYPDVEAVLGVNIFGNSCVNAAVVDLIQKYNLVFFIDAAQSFGLHYDLEECAQVKIYSMHATKVVSACEGGFATTNDPKLAEKMRNIRSSYGMREVVPVPMTGNARMSEAQAAMALLSLEDYEKNVARNKKLAHLYQELLPRFDFLPYLHDDHNYQYVNLLIDEKKHGLSRDEMMKLLHCENVLCKKYPVPLLHRVESCLTEGQTDAHFPQACRLSNLSMQLPSGALVSEEDVASIAALINLIVDHSKEIKERQCK